MKVGPLFHILTRIICDQFFSTASVEIHPYHLRHPCHQHHQRIDFNNASPSSRLNSTIRRREHAHLLYRSRILLLSLLLVQLFREHMSLSLCHALLIWLLPLPLLLQLLFLLVLVAPVPRTPSPCASRAVMARAAAVTRMPQELQSPLQLFKAVSSRAIPTPTVDESESLHILKKLLC